MPINFGFFFTEFFGVSGNLLSLNFLWAAGLNLRKQSIKTLGPFNDNFDDTRDSLVSFCFNGHPTFEQQ